MGYYNYDNHAKIKELLKEKLPNIDVCEPVWGSWYCHHYIQFRIKDIPSNIHFEYYITQNTWEKRRGLLVLHLEPNSDERMRYSKIGVQLMHSISKKNITCETWWNIPFGRFFITDRNVSNVEDLVNTLIELYDIVYNPLKELLKKSKEIKLVVQSQKQDIPYTSLRTNNDDVSVSIMNLEAVMKLPLGLPDYQREYCWEDRNICDLWRNLNKIENNKPFHLGTIILHDYNQKYEIIDGQQRLITLSIMLLALGYAEYLPLLHESYASEDAQRHVSNCKYLVQNLVSQSKDIDGTLAKFVKEISFAILVVNQTNLELAYTFFSHQNSKGVPLTDFDLLKAHHLRYIPDDRQAEHMAIKWNDILQLPSIYYDKNALSRTIGTHIYRLRRWMRKNQSEENCYRYIQREFQAAPLMADIPPFCEKFHFYEKIQGGTHFFVYVETFIHQYEEFIKNKIVMNMHNKLSWGAYEIFADTIETLLFGYYLKFGGQYLAEAFYCISQIMALHRYNSGRVAGDGSGVRGFAMESELLLMIDQASSPSFFLAEALLKGESIYEAMRQEAIKHNRTDMPVNSGLDLPEAKGVKWGYYTSLRKFWHELLPKVSESTIKNKIIEEYGK